MPVGNSRLVSTS